jgi:hypothetical protein
MKKSFFKLFLLSFILIFLASGCVTKPTVTNQPPTAPTTPNPQDNETDVATTVTLSWTCSDPDGDTLTYDVYFGTLENPTLVKEGNTTTSYTVENLNPNTKYYWKVVAKDGKGGVKEGPVWSFTTASSGTVSPVFEDHFEGYTNNDTQYTSSFYGETISSVRSITYTQGVSGSMGVYLNYFDSYICYPTSYLNPTEGTIIFYFKPDPNMYEVYNAIDNPKGGFLMDTVGWLGAFSGSFCIWAGFSGGYNNFSAGTWSGSDWSYAKTDYIYSLSPYKFYKIAFTWSANQGKIKLYLDDTLIAEANYNTQLDNQQLFFIGQNPFGDYWPYGPHSMIGTYDELQIYDVALEF